MSTSPSTSGRHGRVSFSIGCALLGGVTDGVDIRLALAQGEAGSAIVDFARQNDSDLIVLGWRGALEPDRARTMRRVIRESDLSGDRFPRGPR